MAVAVVSDFSNWRTAARELLYQKIAPDGVLWKDTSHNQTVLFEAQRSGAQTASRVAIPRAFLSMAEVVSRHSDPSRWSLLYRVLWRIAHGQRSLMQVTVDGDVAQMVRMEHEVRREAYRMRQFVRFRAVAGPGGEYHVAWYRPEHDVTEANAKFFVDRFGGMRWAILTPGVSLRWDLERLHKEPGMPRSAAPQEDELDDLWRAYYSSIYDPARLNIRAMRAQLPVRRWGELPECRTIAELTISSSSRVQKMKAAQARSAMEFIPDGANIGELRAEVRRCRACGICEAASGPVFGSGEESSKLMLVGEQPGDQEDLAGEVFVGPAGGVLNAAMNAAGLERSGVYLTNAVKGFKFEPRGKRRIHQNPRPGEISTCRPWLDAEIEAIKPTTIVCLGASAALSVLGRTARIQAERGRLIPHRTGAGVVVTYHPSAMLRVQDDELKARMFAELTSDLAQAKRIAGL
jgi:DNA polymerase